MDLVSHIYEVTAEFPDDERFGLTSQLRRASVSVPSNISEGWGRNSQAHLANFTRIARGSLSELDTLIELSRRQGLIKDAVCQELYKRMDLIGRKSFAFLRVVESSVREARATYDEEHLDLTLIKALSDLASDPSEPITHHSSPITKK